MSVRSKKYEAAVKDIPQEASIEDAITYIREHKTASFDETIELHMRLGVDPQKSDQMVRVSVSLPAGSVKKVRILAFAASEKDQKAAKDAGAQIVGGEELIDDIVTNGAPDVDVAVTSPDLMPKVAKAARVLGPKGLMPNPKTGTVQEEIAKAVKELAGGKLSIKMDQHGNIHTAIGKVSWKNEAIVENAQAVLEAVRQARPQTIRGIYIQSVTVASTMGPGISVTI